MQCGARWLPSRVRGWVKNAKGLGWYPGADSSERIGRGRGLSKKLFQRKCSGAGQAGSGGDQARMRAFPLAAAALVWQGAKGIR